MFCFLPPLLHLLNVFYSDGAASPRAERTRLFPGWTFPWDYQRLGEKREVTVKNTFIYLLSTLRWFLLFSSPRQMRWVKKKMQFNDSGRTELKKHRALNLKSKQQHWSLQVFLEWKSVKICINVNPCWSFRWKISLEIKDGLKGFRSLQLNELYQRRVIRSLLEALRRAFNRCSTSSVLNTPGLFFR